MRSIDVPLSLLVLASRQACLVSTAQCDAEGLDRFRRHRLVASGRAAIPTSRVLDLRPEVVRAGIAGDGPDERRRRAACLALLAHGADAIAVGQSALTLLGVQGLPATIRPEVALPTGAPRQARDGIVVRRFGGPLPTVRRGEFLVASPVWALAQAVPELDRDHAVAVLDSAVQRALVAGDDLAEVARLTAGHRGARRARPWWPLVDGRAQSPLETFARLQCVDAGVPPDGLQVPVRDDRGRTIALADLGWRLRRGRWLLVEIDGAGPHGTVEALFRDRERQNALVMTGRADVLRFTARDVLRGSIPAVVSTRLARDRRTGGRPTALTADHR